MTTSEEETSETIRSRSDPRCEVIGCGVLIGAPRDTSRYCEYCAREIENLVKELER